MNTEHRQKLIIELRTAGPRADMLIEHHLGNPAGITGCKPYSRDTDAALTLLPQNTHFLCGRFEAGTLFWCDVGFRPQVQGWGDTLAAAIAGAVFAYRTHPDVISAAAVTLPDTRRPEAG